MPISREEFEKGEIEPTSFILHFFRSNPDTAYSLEELHSILSLQINLDIKLLKEIPGYLEAQEKIKAKKIGTVIYYIYYRRPIGFRPS